jgi:hypothetical protein
MIEFGYFLTPDAGEFAIGGDLPIVRLGYGAMQIPGPGVWGDLPLRRRRLGEDAVRELFDDARFFAIDLGDLVTGGRMQQIGGPLPVHNLVSLPRLLDSVRRPQHVQCEGTGRVALWS